MNSRFSIAAIALFVCVPAAFALDPHKSLTQYSRSVWTQQQGLPQDTIRAIAQTSDGYLWLGTDDGLARFDGYEFTVFNKAKGDLPSNSITALAAAPDGSLWIGTADGLAQYRDKRFRLYTQQQGLPDNAIGALYIDHAGALWIMAGVDLSRFANGKFTTFEPGMNFPLTSFRAVAEDRDGTLWVAGINAVGKLIDGKFQQALSAADLDNDLISGLAVDASDNLWIGGSKGVLERTPAGEIHRFTEPRRPAGYLFARDAGSIATAPSGRAPTAAWRASKAIVSSRRRPVPSRCAASSKIAKAICGWARTTA